jgi:Bacterial antitoxin of type II TA system, VapB
MRTTVALQDELLEGAQSYAGLREESALMREALKALIRQCQPQHDSVPHRFIRRFNGISTKFNSRTLFTGPLWLNPSAM